MKRYLKKAIIADLKEKMVFLGGPRQVGKTTLALSLLKDGNEKHPGYLNWDDIHARKLLLQGALPGNEKLIILDEIHKYKDWRNLVKGFYDVNKSTKKILVTGSAKLDYYRRGGDSLQGRYHFHRLHPLSLYEITNNPTAIDLKTMLQFGGFPEPFLKGNTRHWKRWQKERRTRVIQDDLINLEQVKEITQLDLLMFLLPEKVGSLLSINNLKTDLSVAFETVERWITILENLYVCFRISPFGLPKLRALKKEKKLFMWDWSQCDRESVRFENLVASNLLKYCHLAEDQNGDSMELRFIRDSTGRELDFVVLKNKKPEFSVECKTGDGKLSKNISYFAERTNIPNFFQVHMGKKDYEISQFRARVLPMTTFAKILQV